MRIDELKISGNGYELAASLFKPNDESQFPGVVFYHGMPSQSKPRGVRRAEKLAKRGFIVLTFDFRGCGQTGGDMHKITYKEWLDDALLAFDFLAKQKSVNFKKLGVCGKSFGGYMGAMVAGKRDVKSMVLQAPATYDDATFEHTYTFDTDEQLKFRNSDQALKTAPIRSIEQYKNPLLVVGAEFDEICPRKIVEGYFEHAGSAQKKLKWIKGADHSLTKPEWDDEYIELMIDWFAKTL